MGIAGPGSAKAVARPGERVTPYLRDDRGAGYPGAGVAAASALRPSVASTPAAVAS
jgi:hypothetical protein